MPSEVSDKNGQSPSDTHTDELRERLELILRKFGVMWRENQVASRMGEGGTINYERPVDQLADSIIYLISERERAAQLALIGRLRMDENNTELWNQMAGYGVVHWVRMFNAKLDEEAKKLEE